MARRDKHGTAQFSDINALLLGAWERGARHVLLSKEGDGTELRFLGPDGSEHQERISLPYHTTVARLRDMSGRLGHGRANMAGQRWRFEVTPAERPHPHQLFLHMRAED